MIRLSSVLLTFGLMLLTACATNESRVPPLSRVSHIHVSAWPGWMLGIAPDGSGSIGYGSNYSDFASLPAGTFDFKQAYRALARAVRPDGNMRVAFSVAFFRKEDSVAYSLHTRDAGLVLGLFETARARCNPVSKARIDDLWERMPPRLVNPG